MGERIGYIGLGKMGLALSKVLLEDGHEVCGYDVDEERKKMLADAGGRPLDSGREVEENAEIVGSILLKPEHIEENAFGENGVVSANKSGLVYIEMSTMPPSWQADLAKRLGEHGIEMLDCPISGSHPNVMDRTITMMVGGKKEVFERVRPIFEPLTAGFDYTGESGSGATMKIVTNLYVNASVALLAEVILTGERAGLSHETMMRCLGKGSVRGAMLEQTAPRIFERDFAPRGAVEIFVKDMGMAIDLARENGVDLPIVKAGREMFQRALDAGWGKDDAARVIEVYEGKDRG